MRWTIQCSVILTALTFSVSGEHHETTLAWCIIHMLTRIWKCTASILFRINGLAEATNQLRFSLLVRHTSDSWQEISDIGQSKFRSDELSLVRNFAVSKIRGNEISLESYEISPIFRKRCENVCAKFRRNFAENKGRNLANFVLITFNQYCTTNSYCLAYTFLLKVGRMYFLNFGVKGLNANYDPMLYKPLLNYSDKYPRLPHTAPSYAPSGEIFPC